MKPASHQSQNLSLFNASLDKIINSTHPLVLLSKKIDWEGLAKLLEGHYSHRPDYYDFAPSRVRRSEDLNSSQLSATSLQPNIEAFIF